MTDQELVPAIVQDHLTGEVLSPEKAAAGTDEQSPAKKDTVKVGTSKQTPKKSQPTILK